MNNSFVGSIPGRDMMVNYLVSLCDVCMELVHSEIMLTELSDTSRSTQNVTNMCRCMCELGEF